MSENPDIIGHALDIIQWSRDGHYVPYEFSKAHDVAQALLIAAEFIEKCQDVGDPIHGTALRREASEALAKLKSL